MEKLRKPENSLNCREQNERITTMFPILDD